MQRGRIAVLAAAFAALAASAGAGCAGRSDRKDNGSAGSAPPPSSPQDAAMTSAIDRGPLPAGFDVRVTRVLDEPLPADAVLDVAVVSMGKLPYINHRVRVLADGKVLAAKHSQTPGDWQVPFDRPLAEVPAASLSAADQERWLGRLDRAGFFQHPGYEANAQAQDGSFVIVRARRPGATVAVVYQNTRPAPIDELVGALERLAG